jgi:rubrerythrin
MGMTFDFSKLKPHDVLDLAIFAEQEARDNYEQLATIMRSRHNDHAADFFLRMAGLEKLHHDQIEARRRQLFPDAPASLADRWFWGIEAPDYATVGPAITVRAAYEFALESEVRAHDYYAEAKSWVFDAQALQLFEDLRIAEAEHQRLLRDELARLTE